MNPALLNSIYKISEKNSTNFHELVEGYLNNLFILFLNILDEHNISNLNERIKVKKTLPSGKKYIETTDAGWYFINALFDAPQYQDQIDELNQKFLNHCDKQNKEECLEMIQYLFKELASESLDKNKIIETIAYADYSPREDEYAGDYE